MADESYARGMIRYTSRDYNSIMEEFWELVPKLTELWKPEADADPGVVLGKFLASVADMLGVNVDWLANELFAPSVSQRKNAEKLFGLLGYTLGWYTAARTEVTFKNTTQDETIFFDFGFEGNFATLNAYNDITNQSRVITYNILPLTSKYGSKDTRSRRKLVTDPIDVFAKTDLVYLKPGESVTRVAIEGELRSVTKDVSEIKANNYLITLPSQHIDTTAIWVKSMSSGKVDNYQWIQCQSPAEFITPEPRFSVTYDTYSNAQVQISDYLNQLENFENSQLVIYWIDCSGVIGCVGSDVLSNYLPAKATGVSESSGKFTISNLSNTLELPNTHTITGRSPETAKEAYLNSRNYINTFDSLVTLPDFNRFLNREPGVDCGLVIDCQKALEINMAIYNDPVLTDAQKQKMYITNKDFPPGDSIYNWEDILADQFDPDEPFKLMYAVNFQRWTAMCFAVHNDFKNSMYGQGQADVVQLGHTSKYLLYKPPVSFIEAVKRDYVPLQAMSVELEFGYLRIFPWYVAGQIYTKVTVDESTAANIIAKVKEALALEFSPANRAIGQMPTVMEVVNVIRNADSRIDYFDAGTLSNPVINWRSCDVEYFNPISFARYQDLEGENSKIKIAPTCLRR